MNYQHVTHESIPPYINEESNILILGSLPSIKSREYGFFYAHPQNRFFKTIAHVFNEEEPKTSTDNDTLDLLDDVNKVIEMTEGRRDRRDNKSFQEIFNDINHRLNDKVAAIEPMWKECYEGLFKQMVEIAKNKENAPEQA